MTQVALPLQTSIRSDDADEDIPFRVLNQDNLPMTVIGEKIFKPFGAENQKRKPNGIVYPTRRLDLSNQQVNQQKHLAKSNGHLEGPPKISNNQVKKLSASHGNLNHVIKNKSPDDFTKNLDAKLRKLQTEKKKVDGCKKPFITTVRKGKFLEAPDASTKITKVEEEEIKKNVSIKKQLYAYVSKPMVLSRSPPQNVHRSRCEAAAIAAGLPYAKEIEEDVIDGQKHRKKREAVLPTTTSPEKRFYNERNGDVARSNQKLDLEADQAIQSRAEIAERRAMARKKARLQSCRRSEETISDLHSKKITKLRTVEIQTENYLQASLVKPPIIDMDTQTEPDSIDGRLSNIQKQGHEKETQVTPDDFIDFDEEIQSVLEVVVGKTIESALIEILEEEELAVLKEQQRRFFEIRAEEQRQAGELFEQQFVDHVHKEKSASLFLENYLTQLIPPVLDELKSEGGVVEEEHLHNGSFVPWLVDEVTMELGDILSTGDVLIGIVRDILNRRKEICKAMNNEESDGNANQNTGLIRE